MQPSSREGLLLWFIGSSSKPYNEESACGSIQMSFVGFSQLVKSLKGFLSCFRRWGIFYFFLPILIQTEFKRWKLGSGNLFESENHRHGRNQCWNGSPTHVQKGLFLLPQDHPVSFWNNLQGQCELVHFAICTSLTMSWVKKPVGRCT